jgi:Kef-type K+ transport system membrane component KefB
MTESVHQTEDVLAATLVQLVVIILAARLAGSAAAAIRQPRAVGEIVAGLLLGPSFLATIFPEISAAIFSPTSAASMMVLSQIGLILLMFQIGIEFEFSRLTDAKNRNVVLLIAAVSVTAPLLAGLALGALTAPVLAPGVDNLTYALFVAVALAITAVPILGRILREYSLTRTDVGVIAISAAAANDIVGWLLLAGIAAYASESFSPASTGWQVAGLLVLFVAVWFAGPPIVDYLLRKFPVERQRAPPHLIAIVIALVFVGGLATKALGIFTIFGGFLIGLVFHRHAPFVEAWREQVGSFVLIFFLPIFFTYTGLRTNVWGLDTATDWIWCAIFLGVAIVTKVAPVYLVARLSGMEAAKAMLLGVLMNTRALMELIVLNIGLSLGFIPQDVFTMLVIMAVATTIMTGPLVQILLRRAGHEETKPIEA